MKKNTVIQAEKSIKHGLSGMGLAWISLTVGLFIATMTGRWLEGIGSGRGAVQWGQAVTICFIVIPAVHLILSRLLHIRWNDIGWIGMKRGVLHFIAGAGLAVSLMSVGFIVTIWLDWITITQFHLSSELVISMTMNAVVALMYEAVPEETVLRGLVYTTLRTRLNAFLSYSIQLISFVMVSVTVVFLQKLMGMEAGVQITADYIILLVCFGTTLQLLRSCSHSLWASVGFHLAYLEISRFVVLQGKRRVLTYEEAYPGVGELFVLFFMTIVVAAVLLITVLAIRSARQRRR